MISGQHVALFAAAPLTPSTVPLCWNFRTFAVLQPSRPLLLLRSPVSDLDHQQLRGGAARLHPIGRTSQLLCSYCRCSSDVLCRCCHGDQFSIYCASQPAASSRFSRTTKQAEVMTVHTSIRVCPDVKQREACKYLNFTPRCSSLTSLRYLMLRHTCATSFLCKQP